MSPWKSHRLLFVSAALFSASFLAQNILSIVFPTTAEAVQELSGTVWFILPFLLALLGFIGFLLALIKTRIDIG